METIPKPMLRLATATMENAYAPYSRFHVGACIKSESGDLFVGCNVENASYGATLCAEGSAIAAMISQGQRHIKEVVIIIKGDTICPPCGICRQRLAEFAEHSTVFHLCTTNGAYQVLTMAELMPYPFNGTFLENL